MKKLFGFIIVLMIALATLLPSTLFAENDASAMVGRIYHIEGSLLRYVPSENDWVAAVRDAPFGTGDTLYSGAKGRAELAIPNGTWVRASDNTQIQFIGLDTDVSEIDVASGLARFYNKDADLVIRATSPFGYALVYPNSTFDYYVGENSAEIVPVKGKVTFVHTGTNARYEIAPGNPSILADQNQVTTGYGDTDPDWDGWNRTRDGFWASKYRTKGRSVQYLPASLRQDAYVFDENGRWDRVYYDGGNHWLWRPTNVPVGWAPFTNGRWTEWYGDQTWVPYEPFGYTTHHYGNWVYAQNRWYWAPPVTPATIGLQLLNIAFFWYPGRVSWIYSGPNVGWIPLAPREPYYSHYRWGGPHVVHVTNVNITNINVYPRKYAYARHAVVVPQRDFYTVNNYRNVRIKNINNTTIINNYQASPIVNNRVIQDYSTTKQKYNFTNVQVKEKPHRTVTDRIEANQKTIQRGRIEKASVLEQQTKGMQEGKINREAKIQQPKATNFIVPAQEANRPKSEIRLQQRELRRAARDAKDEPGDQAVKPSPKPGRLTPKPEKIDDEKTAKPVSRPEGISPPPKPDRKTPQREPITTEKPDQSVPKPERVKPPRPRPVEKQYDVAPMKPTTKTDEIAPSKPAPKKERIQPVRPTPQSPEKITPEKQGQKLESDAPKKPVPRHERVAPPKTQPKQKPDKPATAKHGEGDQPNIKPGSGTAPKAQQQE
jgi:hypothetical protein